MKHIKILTLAFLAISFTSCSAGDPPLEEAILGTWIQNMPTSTTLNGLQTTTADTVLRLKKNGETHLVRNLDITGQNLPQNGIRVSVDLKGQWEIFEGQLKQTPTRVLIMPRETDDISRQWADKLQSQADDNPASVKKIISADKQQLILQDLETGTTDFYNRK